MFPPSMPDGVTDHVGDETFDESGVAVERRRADIGVYAQGQAAGVDVVSKRDRVAEDRKLDSRRGFDFSLR
jgi:hypothetical protein